MFVMVFVEHILWGGGELYSQAKEYWYDWCIFLQVSI